MDGHHSLQRADKDNASGQNVLRSEVDRSVGKSLKLAAVVLAVLDVEHEVPALGRRSGAGQARAAAVARAAGAIASGTAGPRG